MDDWNHDTPDIVTRASKFAMIRHAHQTRKYTEEAYYFHCRRVAEAVASKTDDEEIIAAAFLHDTLEDTDTTHGELAREFGGRVAWIVQQLTDFYTPKRFPNNNRASRKQAEADRYTYVMRFHGGGSITAAVKLIKTCDIADNVRDIVEHDPDFAATYLEEKAWLLRGLGYGS